MTAKLAYSTKSIATIKAPEDLKQKYKDEFRKRNELYPYHLRLVFKNKSVVRHFETEKEARFIFNQERGCTAMLIKFNNNTGPRFLAYRYVI